MKDNKTAPQVDKYMLMTIRSINDIKASVLIANSTTDSYVDQCTLLQEGDVLFVRHPYKFLPLFWGNGASGLYSIDVEYTTSNDLSATVNRKRCQRVKNKNTGAADTKIGSTIGGAYSYGFATHAANDILPEAAKDAVPASTPSSGSSAPAPGPSSGVAQAT